MIRKTLLLLPVLATALLASPTLARAAPPGGHARGYSGAFHADPIHSGGVHYAAPHYSYPNYNYSNSGFHPSSSFRPRTSIWYGGYPYYGSYSYPYSNSYTYPSYGYSYYPDSTPTTTYSGTGSYPYVPGTMVPATSEPASGVTSGTTESGQVTSTSSSSPISSDASAQITVHLPANADIWIDGNKRDETGSVRQFTTPMLTAGRQYFYEIHTRWKDGDTMIDQTRNVTFGAGDKIDMTFPVASGSAEKAKEPTQP